MASLEREQNLIIVAAVEGYSREHGITPLETFELFRRHDMFKVLRRNFDALHTQDLFEGARFAHDYLARQAA
ncbi:MAG: DUF3791 domain-containing protein [Bifidobacteriaceae bacterium]|jgi:hypothetical protein|nr:DUF3791 domain-containing protein [Bifidobacteriaceae bacterium]